MLRYRSVVLSATCSGLMLMMTGCGSGGGATTSGTVYSSPEEINQKKKDLKDAMQGGAYGSAGKKSVGLMKD